MIEIGKYQDLEIKRMVEFGAYLGDSDDAAEVLMPRRYLTDEMKPGTMVHVFVYKRLRGPSCSHNREAICNRWSVCLPDRQRRQ